MLNTITTSLKNAHRNQSKISLLIGDNGEIYDDCLIEYIGRSTITFIAVHIKDNNTSLKRHTIKRTLITGIEETICTISSDNLDDLIDDILDDLI